MRIRGRTRIALWLLVVLALAGTAQPLWSAAQEDQAKGQKEEAGKPVLPDSLTGFSDSGTFHLYKNEERLMTITFTWTADGSFQNNSTLSVAGQTVKQSLTIRPDKDGLWATIKHTSPKGDVDIVREGGVAKQTTSGKTVTINLKQGTTLFENYAPALLSQALRAYDARKGGKQSLPVLVLPGTALTGSVEYKDEVERSVAGRDFKFSRYTYSVAGVDFNLWADKEGKIYLGDIPARGASYVREGFEILRQTPETDPLVSKPAFNVQTQENVMIPMRDGIKLATTIYRPQGAGKCPVILIRTPYKKEPLEIKGKYYARRGYAVAIQDCRGRFGSGGAWEPFVNEAKDGFDTIEWLAAQHWSTGKVGMIGGSYVGWVQWWAASQRPPHLVTMIPNVSPPDPFFNLPYEYGVFFLGANIWWADILQSAATADISGAAMAKIGEKKYPKLLRALPVIDLDKAVLGKENSYWRKWIEHPTNDAYWDRASFLERLQDVNIPVFHQSGWFDGDGIGTKLNYLKMTSYKHGSQKLVLGPWGHTDEAARTLGERDFGSAALVDLPRAYLRWFDFWLKGIDNGVTREPLVSLFVMGSNEWVHGDTYPFPETKFEKWYLASNGQANTSRGDGHLSRLPPAGGQPTDRYTYDPGDPTPDPNYFDEDDKQPDGDKKPKSSEEQADKVKAYHDKLASSRKDMLLYTSEPLEQAYTFVGPLGAVLYAASSAKDTDWFVRLVDVDEKGKLLTLGSGKIRARFRQSMKEPTLLESGKVYEYTLDLWHTGITIPAKHRLRVEVSSASFPLYSRNLNTGGHNEKDTHFEVAEQTVYHSSEYPTHVVLPVILLPAKKGK
jgi:putative CocE/NonD family hydrolase